MTRIIAFTGPKTCGKDTMAKILFNQNKPDTYFMKSPFANGIKTICSEVFGWNAEQMGDPEFKETVLQEWPNIEPRWAMMDIGNWMREKYGPEVWVNMLKRRIAAEKSLGYTGAFVITDLRFPNEIEWLMQENSLVFYVDRIEAESALSAAKVSGDPKALNPSEAHYDLMREKADYILDNNDEVYKGWNNVLTLVRKEFGFWRDWT
jgi:hypothetical protein